MNPSHLDPVTRSENSRRQHAATVKEFCPRGHRMVEENIYRHKGNGRRCRTCAVENQRRIRASRI